VTLRTRALFRDRSFIAGDIFIFVFGLGIFATLALVPPMLGDLSTAA
jgi:DHA2 family multidrug resistance protein